MKKIKFILMAVAFAGCQKNAELSSPALNSNSSTTISATPLAAAASVTVTTEAALRSAVSSATGGTVITISGTIRLTSTLQCLNSGSSSAKINLTGGTLDCSGIASPNWGVKVNGSYWNITNMNIQNSPDCGLVFQIGGNNYVNNVHASNNKNSGIQVYNGAYNVSVNNSTSTGNYDAVNQGENADGFTCKLSGGTGNQFNGCTATTNSDDGWDLYGQQNPVKITGCTANSNGRDVNGDGNGFKLGSAGLSVAHTITNCSASNNSPGWGFTRNGNAKGVIHFSGLTGSGNKAGLSDL
jgi:hypothetical protein